jgi:hypothetical protein
MHGFHLIRGAALGGLLLLPLGAIACGGDNDGGADPDDPTPSASIAPIEGVELPAAAADYAQALFAAWAADDEPVMRQLATAETADTLVARPWAEADAWEFETCTANAGSTFCTWQGATEQLTIELEASEIVEDDQAAVSATFGPPGETGATTDLPRDPEGYADAAYDAWANGNDDQLDQMLGDDAFPLLATRAWLPSDGWKKSGCESTSEGFFCRWEATNGEQLEMRLDEDDATAGAQDAVTDVIFTGF